MRAAWRRFAEWSTTCRQQTVPVFPYAEVSTVPDSVCAALRILRQEGITTNLMQQLTWDVETDPGIASLWTDNEAAEARTCLRSPEGTAYDLIALDKTAMNTLRTWGYPVEDLPPTSTDPLVPRSPSDRRAMPLGTLRRLMRREL